MARRRRGSSSSTRKERGLARWDWRVGRAWLVRAGKLACVVGVVAAAGWGMSAARAYVHGMAEYRGPVRLELMGLPGWLEQRENRHIVESVVAAVGLEGRDRYLDDGLVARVGQNLEGSGWVRRVIRVEKRYGGVVRAWCEFRRPVAWVMHGDECYLVDGEGVRLPGRYGHEQVCEAGLMQVAGVAAGPPRVGQVWPGEDMKAGVKLALLLEGRPYRGQIKAVLVHNYGGREDGRRPHVELVTDRPGARIRWGRAPGEELGIEPTAEQKLALLQGVYRKYQRVDMGRPYVDIRRNPYSVDVPEEGDGLAGAVGS